MYLRKFIIGKEGKRCQVIIEKTEIVDKEIMKKQDHIKYKKESKQQVKEHQEKEQKTQQECINQLKTKK